MWKKKTTCLTLLFVFLSSLIPRLILIKTSFWTSPDALEYINVAKNLATGKGFITTIKIHHFDDGPIIRSALGTKPPLFSLFIAPFYKLWPNLYFIQLINLILGAAAAVFFYILCRQYLSVKWSLVAAFLLNYNPDFLINNRLILTEPLFLCCSFLALIFANQSHSKQLFLSALFAVLAFLTRVEGISIAITISLNLLFKKERSQWRFFSSLFFLCLFPYLLLNYLTNKSFLTNVGNFHFLTLNFLETVFNQYGQPIPSLNNFVLTNWLNILKNILNTSLMLLKTLLKPSAIGLLIIPIITTKPTKKIMPFLLIILINFLIICFTWGLIVDPSRYLLLIDSMLILLAILRITKFKKIVRFIFIGTTLIFYFIFDGHRLYWARTQFDPSWNGEDINKIILLINEQTKPNDVIAAPNPGLINIKTDRPAVVLPNNLNFKLINQFIHNYQPKAFLTYSPESTTFFTLNNLKWKKIKTGPYYLFFQ